MLFCARPRLAIVLALLLALSGCGATPAAAPPTSAPQPTAPPTAAPTAPPTDAATAPPAAAPANDVDMTRMLVAAVIGLQPTTTTTATSALEIHAFPLRQDNPDARLWVAYSSGDRVRADSEHFVSIYTPKVDGWELVSTLTVTNSTIIEAGGVEQVTFVSGKTWLAVKGSSGLVGPCCFELLSFDGASLRSELLYSERNIDLDTIQIGPNPDGQPQISIPVVLYKGIEQPTESFTVNFVWDGRKIVKR